MDIGLVAPDSKIVFKARIGGKRLVIMHTCTINVLYHHEVMMCEVQLVKECF